MRCIFCKSNSSGSRSVEHIIPEALGNTEHILPRGVVCDKCNNYFARKIEKPLLDTVWLRHIRSRQWIPNKRGFVPPMTGVVPGANVGAYGWVTGNTLELEGMNEKEHFVLSDSVRQSRARKVYFPLGSSDEAPLLSRFLAKVGIEILVHKTVHVPNWEEEVIDNVKLDKIRHFARVGDTPKDWPISKRRIYAEDHIFFEEESYQVIHEYDLLYTESYELYSIVCLFGEEFTINLGSPEISGYYAWLDRTKGRSPLY